MEEELQARREKEKKRLEKEEKKRNQVRKACGAKTHATKASSLCPENPKSAAKCFCDFICSCWKRAAAEAAKRAACSGESSSACVCGLTPKQAAQRREWYDKVGRAEEAALKRKREYHAELAAKKAAKITGG